MKLFLTANHHAAKITRQKYKIKAVEDFIGKTETRDKRDVLIELTHYLLLPDSYLLTLPAPLIFKLLLQIQKFLQHSPSPVQISPIPIIGSSQLLLVNSRKADYLVDSVIALQQYLQMPFQLLAHPVLEVNRESGIAVNSVAQAQLLVIRLEDFDVSDTLLLSQHIQRVVAAVLAVDVCAAQISAQIAALKVINALQPWRIFIDWLGNGSFTFFRYQQFSSQYLHGQLEQLDNNASGIALSNDKNRVVRELQRLLTRVSDIAVVGFPVISPVLRCDPLVYIGLRENKGGNDWIEHGFFGLFNETELNGSADKVPALKHKIVQTLDKIKVAGDGYEYCQLREIFNLLPKVELFLVNETQMLLLAQSLLQYVSRPSSVKCLVLASPSPFRVSLFIVVPVALYRDGVEALLFEWLAAELQGERAFSRKIQLGGRFIGLHLTLKPTTDNVCIDVECLDRQLNKLARPWSECLRKLMIRTFGRHAAANLWEKYQQAFSNDYQSLLSVRHALRDIIQIEQLLELKSARVCLLSPCKTVNSYRLHFYSLQEHFLDEYIPVLANLNLRLLDQVQFVLNVVNAPVYIKSFSIKAATTQCDSFSKLRPLILDMIQAILDKKTANDALNQLLVLTGMTWKQIDVLRGYRNYYMQLGYQSSSTSFHHALLNNPQVARCLFDYFEARFRPDKSWDDPVVREEQALFPLRLSLLQNLAAVADINDDRILRTLFNLIDATVRSNFHVRSETDRFFFAFKINSLGIIDMPAPRPQNEIYVHSATMQGIHLRGGKISRGGIRWSDRPDDFRTEILGLMQTQMSKNALIIPKGAKGGFVVKQLQPEESFKAAGKAAYITLIKGMLDLTDNYVDETVAQLPGLVSYDDADPYLVVAADKGTAQFPDIANNVAKEYHFWLQDAFASGGSSGYNHKQLGITARGAWECVKRHFRELGKNIQEEPFSVVGIGSMDGDVFGNGMLLSPCIRLFAAISGQHIFIDPDPADQNAAYKERKRLFDTPGSSWNDYQRSLISPGGGVYSRNAKDIMISPQVRHWLGIRYQTLDGESLIRYLLSAEVELLWLGGIGTYVKASTESQDNVGDRSNDSVRIDATEIRANVVGEGANLGFTQKARIEYSLKGGRINTDAIDNSAGVDISDHEVNLKIFLTTLYKKNIVQDFQKIFIKVSDAVCRAVLENNYMQSLALSLDHLRAVDNSEIFMRLAEHLEAVGLLDRSLESFPLAKQLLARTEANLTRPELAVLLAASKMQLSQQVQEHGALLDAPESDNYLAAYFPEQIARPYSDYLSNHPLARQIKATIISNTLINQAGCGFLALDAEAENGDLLMAVSCYLTFDQVLGANILRQKIYALDNQLPAQQQYQLLLLLERALMGFCHWAITQGLHILPDEHTLKNYRNYLQENINYLQQTAKSAAVMTRLQRFLDAGVPEDIAQRIALIASLDDFPQIVELVKATGRECFDVLQLFNEIMKQLELDRLLDELTRISVHNRWEQKILKDLQCRIKKLAAQFCRTIISAEQQCSDYFSAPERHTRLTNYQRLCQEIVVSETGNILAYVTLVRELEKLP